MINADMKLGSAYTTANSNADAIMAKMFMTSVTRNTDITMLTFLVLSCFHSMYPHSGPKTPTLNTLAPSVVSPPKARIIACRNATTNVTSAVIDGPKNTVRSPVAQA